MACENAPPRLMDRKRNRAHGWARRNKTIRTIFDRVEPDADPLMVIRRCAKACEYQMALYHNDLLRWPADTARHDALLLMSEILRTEARAVRRRWKEQGKSMKRRKA